MTAELRRWAVVALLLASVCGSLTFLSSADGKATTFFPYIGGNWKVAATSCPQTCYDIWPVVPLKPHELAPYHYKMTDAKGFYLTSAANKPPNQHPEAFTIPADGKLELIETCNGCTGYNLLKLTFEALPGGIKRFTGSWQPFAPRSNAPGSPVFAGGKGHESGELIKPQEPSAGNPGTAGWGPSKCRRALAAWTKAHPNATSAAKAAETRTLDSAHGCSL